MRKFQLFSLIILCFSLATVSAKESSQNKKEIFFVEFGIEAELKPENSMPLGFPISIVKQLSRQSPFIDIQVQETSNKTYNSIIKFKFPNMDEFNKWYISESSKKLFQALEKSSNRINKNLIVKKEFVPESSK